MASCILLIRHAKAKGASSASSEERRKLSTAGKRAGRAAMRRMASLLGGFVDPDAVSIWSSTATRAYQTAEMAADALEIDADRVKVVDALSDENAEALLEKIEATEGAVVAVARGPFVEALTQQMCGDQLHFGKAAIACLVPREDGQEGYDLAWFLQGPPPERWETMIQLEKAFAHAGEQVSRRAKQLRNNPDDVEALHQYRISLRVARSLVTFAKPYLRKEVWAEASEDLRELQAPTSELREYDVIFGQLSSASAEGEDADVPAWSDQQELLDSCAAQRDAVRKRFFSEFGKRRTKRQLGSIVRLLKSVRWRGAIEGRGLSVEELRGRYFELAAQYRDELAACDFGDAEATHAVRKRSKQQRYIARELGAILGEDCVKTGDEAREAQELLGELCDARVNLELAAKLQGKREKGGANQKASYAHAERAREKEILKQLKKHS